MFRSVLATLACWTCVHAVSEGCFGDPADSTVPVVATYEDLAGAPRHPLPEKGGTVQLGIEARSVPWGRGCLVYCRSEVPVGGGGRGEILGPVSLVVKRPGTEILFQMVENLAGTEPDGPAVYATAIGFPEPGEYRLIAYDGDREVAATGIRATDEPFHSFAPFRPVADSRELVREDAGEVVVDLAPELTMPGRPRFEGAFPLAETGAGPEAADAGERELPDLFAWRPDEGLTLTRRDDGALVLASDTPIRLRGIEERLLARWWVDGEPALVARSRRAEELRDRTGRAINGHRVVIRVPQSALPGEGTREIGVQILACPMGWEFASVQKRLARLAMGPCSPPRLSNRITWTQAGDDGG